MSTHILGNAIEYCLREAGIQASDLSYVGVAPRGLTSFPEAMAER